MLKAKPTTTPNVFMFNPDTVNYRVTIKTSMTYHLAIKYVGIGINLRQTTLAL